ncbi:hypothetical protein BDN72DRAFT_876579 [Pluteus cervinus]|uniref:Uncharacterized protein n=1 Tax=Pluteus cervinus TaxID=181527 RepID=A0ACD3B5N9_9AGAR|nr:hypothetical protein BDN72DRAFT_876579 [Pluteus cervinus]
MATTTASTPLPNAPVFDFSKTKLARDYTGSYVKILDNVFTAEECAALIRLAESDAKWEQAALHYGLGPEEKYVDTAYRNSDRILRWDQGAADMMLEKLKPYVPELWEIRSGDKYEGVVSASNKVLGTWKLVAVNERLSFLKYGPGHYFKGHCDGQPTLPDGRKARVTIQIYLNEEGLEGGATRIWDSRQKNYIDVNPKLGRVLVFQQRGIWHSGEEVTKGLKYTIRSDLLFRVEEDWMETEETEEDEEAKERAREEAKKAMAELAAVQSKLGTGGLQGLKRKLGWGLK